MGKKIGDLLEDEFDFTATVVCHDNRFPSVRIVLRYANVRITDRR